MYGYPQQPPPRSGTSALTIVLVVLVAVLILGGGGCLLCIGLAASVDDGNHHDPPTASAPSAVSPSTNLVRDAFAQDLENRLRQQGVPATIVLCPPVRQGDFTCELTVGADKADVQVKQTSAGMAFDVPGVAFLDGSKLTASFQSTIASKIDGRLRVPCFTGTLMKKVGAQFSCDVVLGTSPAGSVAVTVGDAKGNVRMDYTSAGTAAPVAPALKPAPAPTGPRIVDFVCPPGQTPGGAVRAGCVCGSQVLGTACGAPGNFTDVTETPRGCRFVCN